MSAIRWNFAQKRNTSFILADIGTVSCSDSGTVGSALSLRVGCRCGGDVTVAAALQSAQLAEDGVQIDILGICDKTDSINHFENRSSMQTHRPIEHENERKRRTTDAREQESEHLAIVTVKEGSCSTITIAEELLMAGTTNYERSNDETSSALITSTIVRSSGSRTFVFPECETRPRVYLTSCNAEKRKSLAERRNEQF